MEARKQKAQNTTISNIESGKMATALNSQKYWQVDLICQQDHITRFWNQPVGSSGSWLDFMDHKNKGQQE